jgi:hypothetical protein
MRGIALAMICGLSACAAPGFKPYVTRLSPEASSQAAYDIAAFVGQQIKPSAGSIAVLQAPDDTVWPKLTADLRAEGYTISDDAQVKHHLRFAVSNLPDGTVLRATLDMTSMAQLYHARGADEIEPSGPATILSTEAE